MEEDGITSEPNDAIESVQAASESEVKPEASIDETLISPRLTIDPEFQALIPPLSEEEFAALREDIILHGCCDPLKVWKGHNIILDGHHRFRICEELGISPPFIELEFPDRIEAKIWIIKNQRGRRNLNESQRAMLAVTLEALYSEQAEERMGTRTDLDQNLDQGDAGRSAVKAAKDMGISHQTVSHAKKVATQGIPDLVKLVESGDAAVSAAARAAPLPADTQKQIVETFETPKSNGENPNITAIMREIIKPQSKNDDPDIRLEKFRKSQEEYVALLEGIEKTTRPENLFEMQTAAEKIMERLKKIESHSLETGQSLTDFSIIELRTFKTFIQSLLAANNDIKLRFDSEGVRGGASNMTSLIMADAFLPKDLFSRYQEIGEIGLNRGKNLEGYLTIRLDKGSPGKKNIRFFVEPRSDSNESERLHVITGVDEFSGTLGDPRFIDEMERPNRNLTATVIVSGKELLDALKTAKNVNKIAKFLVSDQKLKIVAQDDKDGTGVIVEVSCEIVKEGYADSKFGIELIQATNRTISKSDKVTLSLGMGLGMIMEAEVEGITVKYFIEEATKR